MPSGWDEFEVRYGFHKEIQPLEAYVNLADLDGSTEIALHGKWRFSVALRHLTKPAVGEFCAYPFRYG